MHECYMIFAVFALIFRCWTFCFTFDLIKVLVFACFVLYLLVSAFSFTSSLFIYTWRREQQNEEGIRGRAPTVRSTVPHGCALFAEHQINNPLAKQAATDQTDNPRNSFYYCKQHFNQFLFHFANICIFNLFPVGS